MLNIELKFISFSSDTEPKIMFMNPIIINNIHIELVNLSLSIYLSDGIFLAVTNLAVTANTRFMIP